MNLVRRFLYLMCVVLNQNNQSVDLVASLYTGWQKAWASRKSIGCMTTHLLRQLIWSTQVGMWRTTNRFYTYTSEFLAEIVMEQSTYSFVADLPLLCWRRNPLVRGGATMVAAVFSSMSSSSGEDWWGWDGASLVEESTPERSYIPRGGRPSPGTRPRVCKQQHLPNL